MVCPTSSNCQQCLLGHTSIGHVPRYIDLVGCVLVLVAAVQGHLDRHLWASGAILQGGLERWARFIAYRARLERWARFIAYRAPILEESKRCPRHFWSCRACLGYSPALAPTWKKPCATLIQLMRRATNTDIFPFQTSPAAY